MRRLLVVMLLTACAPEPPQVEFGVDVFSNDTMPAKFVVTLSGNLSMAVRSNQLYMRPDQSLVLETPGSLIIQQGMGSAVIASFDSTQQIAVMPLGTSPDSTDNAVVGKRVKVTRKGEEKRVTIELEKP
jgi:hypothetical protein